MEIETRFGVGLKIEREILTIIYYDTNYEYTDIADLVRNSNLPKATVENWFTKQKVFMLHKPVKHRFWRRRYIVSHIDDKWQAGLFDMQKYQQHH